jgi:hypothetical protein
VAPHGKRVMRVDTTVVETNIHYPTDTSLLGDGVRVLTRAMKRIAVIAGEMGAKLRDRSRSVKYRILEIGRAARSKGGAGKEKLQQGYGRLLASVSRVVGQAKRFSREIASGVKKSSDVFQVAEKPFHSAGMALTNTRKLLILRCGESTGEPFSTIRNPFSATC